MDNNNYIRRDRQGFPWAYLIGAILVVAALFGVYKLVQWQLNQRDARMEAAYQAAFDEAIAEMLPVDVEKPIVVVAETCSYDYSVMPTGRDSEGRPLADRGVSYVGEISGPAVVQIDSLTAIAIFPGEIYNIPDGDIVTWKYIGDDDCLLSQYQWFPGKNIIRLAN